MTINYYRQACSRNPDKNQLNRLINTALHGYFFKRIIPLFPKEEVYKLVS